VALVRLGRFSRNRYKLKKTRNYGLNGSLMQKGEPGGSPVLPICCVVTEATRTARVFSGDAHRESGVFSCRAALCPVESCSLQSW
jgi:hypothetical protein